jgi:drug/metabolite transporter (DMT)-like permease
VAYYTFLLKAYSYGDLSHTYPIARGLGPLLVALVSGRVIGEHLRPQDILGVLLLSAGLITLAMPLKPVAGPARGRHGLATLFAALTGVTIAAYIIADGMGVRSAGPDFEHRLAYIAWLCVLEGPWLLIFALASRPGAVWPRLKRNWWLGRWAALSPTSATASRSMPLSWVRWRTSRRCARLRSCLAH